MKVKMRAGIILYHGSCYDGFGAAFAAWKHFGNEVDYKPVSYGFPMPDVSGYEHVYIVDFSYKRDELIELAKNHTVTVLDHHKTAQEELKDLDNVPNLSVYFDMERSGALMAWEYFHSTIPPMLIQHISDRDLWKFKIPYTKEVHKALVSYPMDFEVWDKFDVFELIKEGVTCNRLYDQLVDNICKNAWMIEIDEHTIPVVNTSIAWSEVGARLLELHTGVSFVASFTVFNNQVMWSLRSKDDFDVSAVAKKFGGGGHKNAAGYKTTRF